MSLTPTETDPPSSPPVPRQAYWFDDERTALAVAESARASGLDQVAEPPARSWFPGLAGGGLLPAPLPGSGLTVERFSLLAEIAAQDLSTARLAEGHLDVVAILAEAGCPSWPEHELLGVWASRAPGDTLAAVRAAGGWKVSGRRPYCSGADQLHRVLAPIDTGSGLLLFELDLESVGARPVDGTWPAVGMAGSDSRTVELGPAVVPDEAVVGGPGFYLDRPGFWHGAVGVAACWAGGAMGVMRTLRAAVAARGDDHALAHLGAAHVAWTTMTSALRAAAAEIDADPGDLAGGGRERSLTVRATVEAAAQEVMARSGRATGAGPLSHDPAHARRIPDLVVYLRQHHGERDLAGLGRLLLDRG